MVSARSLVSTLTFRSHTLFFSTNYTFKITQSRICILQVAILRYSIVVLNPSPIFTKWMVITQPTWKTFYIKLSKYVNSKIVRDDWISEYNFLYIIYSQKGCKFSINVLHIQFTLPFTKIRFCYVKLKKFYFCVADSFHLLSFKLNETSNHGREKIFSCFVQSKDWECFQLLMKLE